MRFSSGDCGFFLIDGYNVLGVSSEIRAGAKALTAPFQPLGPTGRWNGSVPIGVPQARLSQQGWFDAEADSIHAALKNQEGVSRVSMLGHEGNVLGRGFHGYAGLTAVGYGQVCEVRDLVKAAADYEIDGAMEEGLVIATLGSRTADGHTEATPVDHGAATTAGASVFLALCSLTLGGFTNLTVKIRHSVDGVAWADLVTMTARTLAPAAERKVIAAGTTINRRLAVSWDFTGAGVDPAAVFVVGVARK